MKQGQHVAQQRFIGGLCSYTKETALWEEVSHTGTSVQLLLYWDFYWIGRHSHSLSEHSISTVPGPVLCTEAVIFFLLKIIELLAAITLGKSDIDCIRLL